MPALGGIIAVKLDTSLGARMANANPAAQKFGAAVSRLTSELTAVDKELSLDSRSNPEDQLKAPVARFVEDAGASLIKTIRITTEHRQSAGDVVEGVRLDMAIKRGRGKLATSSSSPPPRVPTPTARPDGRSMIADSGRSSSTTPISSTRTVGNGRCCVMARISPLFT